MDVQEVMNQAYDRWDQSKIWTKEQFWASLSRVEKVSVYVGNLNYQVENGGFIQWHDNKYSDCAAELAQILFELGPIGERVSKLVEQVMNEINDNLEYPGDWETYVYYDENAGEEVEDEEWVDYDLVFSKDYDQMYYDLNEQLLVELENYVQQLQSAEQVMV
jgi:hypothetical protein